MSWACVGAIGGAAVSTIGGKLLNRSNEKAAKKANNAAAEANQVQTQIAREQWDRYKEIYEPLERQMVSEAQNYDSPEKYAQAAGQASATVSQQFSKARDRLTRTPGLDPSSGAYQSSIAGLNLAQAANDASQQNIARQNVSDTAYARKQAALGLGKGLDSAASNGLASVANANRQAASGYQAQGAQTAEAFGRVTDRVISGWLGGGLGGGGSTGAAAPASVPSYSLGLGDAPAISGAMGSGSGIKFSGFGS